MAVLGVVSMRYLILSISTKPKEINTESYLVSENKTKSPIEGTYAKSELNFIEIAKKELVETSPWKIFQ